MVSHAGDGRGPVQVELRRDSSGLALVSDGLVLRADFATLLRRIRPACLSSELLVRAARVRGVGASPFAIDATAGLGEDALLLAASGFTIRMYERNPLVAAVLRDALERARATPGLAEVACRMSLVEADSIRELPRLSRAPDVVLLDPMFPRKRKDAASKKKLQMLQRLERPCEDEGRLLDAAVAARPRKVVVKRPATGPCLAGREPTHVVRGKTIRFDCYVLPR